MGLGQSKKSSRESQSDFKPTRASRQNSEHSIKSERFVSPPTSLTPAFCTVGPVNEIPNAAEAQPRLNEKPATIFSTGLNNKISYANAIELEKRLNKLQHDGSLSGTSEKNAHCLRQGQQLHQERSLEPLQQQQQEEQQGSQLQQLHQGQHLQQPQQHQSQKSPQQSTQQQQLKQLHQQSVKSQAQTKHQPAQQEAHQFPKQLQQTTLPQKDQQHSQQLVPQQCKKTLIRQQQHQPTLQKQQEKVQQLQQITPACELPQINTTPQHHTQPAQEIERQKQHRRLAQQDQEVQRPSQQQPKLRSKQQKEAARQPAPQLEQPEEQLQVKQQAKLQQHERQGEAQHQHSQEKQELTEQQKPMPQHQETKQTQCQKQNLQQRQQDSSPTKQEQNQPVPLQLQQQMQHNCEQEQVNTKNQPQLHPPSQPQQQQNYSQVVQQQQRNQQQVRVNQVQSNLPKKSKKQVKREQRLRVLQEQQLAKNAEHDEQHPTQQHPRHPRQEQMQQPTNQVSQPQPQVIALKEQQQSKKLQEQETLKPGRQEQLGHPKLEKKNQPTLQQAQHNQPNADQDQKDNKSKQNPPKQTHEREKAPKKKTVNVELAATYRSKQNSNSKAQNSFPRNVVRTQGKPVPLMGISFPRQKSNLLEEPSAAFVQTATQSGMQNQKKPFLTTSSKPGTPTPQSEQDPRAAVISSQITFQCPQEFRNEASQKIIDHKETSTVPRKQRSRTVSSVGPKEKSCQCGHQKQDKMRSPDREKLEQDESQKKLLLEQSSQQQQHQRELKHTHPNQEQRQQKIKQNPPKKQKERERQQQYQQHQQQGQKQQEEFASESAAPVVAKGRAKLKAVHEFQPHPPAFAASAAAFQAQLALTQPPQAPHTARKHKPVAGDATMEMFKSLQVQDSSVAAQANSDAHPKSKTADSRAATQQSVAPWAVVYNKVSDEDLLSEPSAVDTGKKERREGHGFFSRIFGKKSKALKAKKVPSSEIEQLSDCMQGLKIGSSSPIQDVDVHGESDTDHSCSDTEVPPSSPADDEGSDLAEKSDESSDLEPPSCMEAWEIADDVVEKALCLLPIQVGTVHSRRFTAPDCPFEPELVQRLVSDALEAKRGLKRIKESQALLETFRDCLLKFFEGKDVGDVLPPCNHAPGSHQCSMQPVIQPLLGIIRHVLQETKAIGGPKMEAGQRLNKDGKSQAEPGELRPRRYIKIKRKLTATQAFRAPTKLSVRFCNACADTKQPDGQPLLSCGRCPDVFYCSRECQNVDWITHKFTCPGGDRRSYCKHHGT